LDEAEAFLAINSRKGEKEEEYLTLADLGVKEEDVLFIGDDSTPEFKKATEHLLSATMVSFKLILTHLRLVLILNSEVE
jgi:hypothetical protein